MNMLNMIFDKAAEGLSAIEKMKLLRQLKMTRTDIAALGTGALAVMARLKLTMQAKLICAQLGGAKNEQNKPLDQQNSASQATNLIANEPQKETTNVNEAPVPVQAETQRSQTPNAEPEPLKKSAGKRQKDNNAAIEALRKVKAGEADPKDPVTRETLKGYSGSGGGLKTAQGTSGSPHEYYTPAPVAAAMWGMLAGLGFAGGKVLDPSSGMGVFARTKPDSVAIEQIELDEISGEINGLLNDGPTVSTRVASFEEVAASTDDETFDAVVTNVPFGDKAMRGAHWRKDPKYQNANLQEYFILRGLEKIKAGGFAAFIVPPSVVSGQGGKGAKLRNAISMAAEFVGAYRLPNMVFDEAGADTITDIIILRKHGKANKAKIDELAQQNAAMLTEANVIWPDFVDGHYFKLEGKRFQIGETTTGKGKFGEVEKVAFTGTIGSIAALLKPFPKGSRIDWALLDTVETAPIVYVEGDTVFSGGAMLQMTDGKLVPMVGGLQNDDVAAINLLARFTSPLDSINQGLTFDDASRALANEATCGRLGDVPRWILSAQRAAQAVDKNQGEWFDAILAGMAVQEFGQSTSKDARNYSTDYPVLSKVLARVQGYAAKRTTDGGEIVKQALQNIAVARRKGAFTAWWTGNIAKTQELILTVSQSYAKIKMDNEDETGFVPASELRKAFSDFDPLNDDAWCVSPDGAGIMSADDYYFGNYGQFLARAEKELLEAVNPAVKEKLMRQHAKAKERITLIDPSRMRFSLESAFVSQQDKAEFIRQYVSNDIVLGDEDEGKRRFKYIGKSSNSGNSDNEVNRIKALRRFTEFLNSKTITTRNGDSKEDPQAEQALLEAIKSMVSASNAKFDSWCKSNEDIASELRARLNEPSNLRFTEVPDFAPVDIPNWNPDWVPHGYQYGAVRQFSKRFSGLLSFDVGLGKTLTALATVQYAQSIGAKKKTIFVVPSATLTNWKKEVGKAYQDTDDCLFVGLVLDKSGKPKYNPSSVDADLNVIRENRHAKIFMTYETLTRIPLREETLEGYASYLLSNDDSFVKSSEEGAKKKTRDVISSEAAVAAALSSGKKSSAVPYFEDMGIDSIVIDEAHAAKNSKKTSSEFKAAKFIANPESSQRGMDMQAKCWYIRGTTTSGDGVLGLTATPITNSPVEVYAMMSLAIGEREMNAMCGCTGADSFMMNTCDIENRNENNMLGEPVNQRVLAGLANLDILRRVLDSSAMIETPESVAAKGIIIAVPESEESMTGLELPPVDTAILLGIQAEYKAAAEKSKTKATLSPREATMASPLNALRRMTKLITDKELHLGKFEFAFSPADKAKAEALVTAFNKLKITEECKGYEIPDGVDTSAMKSKIKVNPESGDALIIYSMPVLASIKAGKIILPAIDYKTHDRFINLVDKAGVKLAATASPKMLALLSNLQKENAHPRWKPAKQIVFCDELALHHKLKLLIAAETGIPSSKICIVNAKSVSPDEIQDVQDGFNANEDDNRYQIIIANKKAEVGINLQDGTQAIHHLTIGWTPDSIHQRNGRGVRQGNKIETPVMIYHYEANGTFDSYKRRLVSVKGDWIKSLMDKDAETVVIEGDLSEEDKHRMTMMVGDPVAMAQFNIDMAKKARAQVSDSAKITQVNAIFVAQGQKQWLDNFGSERDGFTEWVKGKAAAANLISSEISRLRQRAQHTQSSDVAKLCVEKIAQLTLKLDAANAVFAGVSGADAKNFIAIVRNYTGTAAATNWAKDVTINRKMMDEAKAACDMRATQGYSKETIAQFDRGEAVILNGKILCEGDFAVADGKPGLIQVTKADYGSAINAEFIFSSGASLTSKSIAGMTIESHGTVGSDARADILKMLVELDEINIAAKSEHLFARRSAEVRGALRSVIPSLWVVINGYFGGDNEWIAAPNFPLLMPENAEGEFCQSIVAAQASVVEVREAQHRFGSASFRFIDVRNQSEQGGRTVWGAIAGWMMANDRTMTLAELVGVDGRRFSSDFRVAFGAGLDGMIAKSGNMAEFEAAMISWARAAYPWVTGFDASMVGRLGLSIQVEKAKVKLDDGSVKYDVVVTKSELGHCPALAKMNAAIVAKFADGALNAGLIGFLAKYPYITGLIADTISDHLGNTELVNAFNQVVCEAVGGRLSGGHIDMTGSPFEDEIRAFIKTGKGAVIKLETKSIFNADTGEKNAVLAYAAKQKVSGMGLDIDGMLAAIGKVPGVAYAVVGMKNYAKVRDKYTGSHLYMAGEYVRLSVPRDSDLNARFANRVTGLAGRVFDSGTKDFLISLVPAKFSDAKDVADIVALARYLSIDPTPFKKG